MDQDSLLRGVADVGGRGKRQGAPDGCNNVRRIALYMTHPGPHTSRFSREGLTQTRPALLPHAGALRVWVLKSRGPGGSGSPAVGGKFSHCSNRQRKSQRQVRQQPSPSCAPALSHMPPCADADLHLALLVVQPLAVRAGHQQKKPIFSTFLHKGLKIDIFGNRKFHQQPSSPCRPSRRFLRACRPSAVVPFAMPSPIRLIVVMSQGFQPFVMSWN